jgi:hypothetical protein
MFLFKVVFGHILLSRHVYSQRVEIQLVRNRPDSVVLLHQQSTSLEDIINKAQPQLMTIICGDFNSRIGSSSPKLDMEHPKRTSTDKVVCQRAPWLLELCELY